MKGGFPIMDLEEKLRYLSGQDDPYEKPKPVSHTSDDAPHSINPNMVSTDDDDSVDSISIDSDYKDKENRLGRKITASIYLSISNLQSHCDVVEWSFNPCSMDSAPGHIGTFTGATDWRDFDKTYSIEYFIMGMFRAAHLSTCSTKPNYILISKHRP